MISGSTLALFVRGLRWRRGFSIAVLLIGVICASVASIGPLYARAVSESTLTDQLREAGSSAGLAYAVQGNADEPNAAAAIQSQLGSAAQPPGFGTPILGRSVLITAKTPANSVTTISTLVWRDNECAHLVITSGRCPDRPGEALVPEAATGTDLSWKLGSPLTVYQDEITTAGNTDGPIIAQVTITGSYRPRDTADPYWFQLPYFASELGPAQTSAIKGGADAIFVAQSQFTAAPAELQTEVDVDVPLVPNRVRLADVPALKHTVAGLQHQYHDTIGNVTQVALQTGLPAALAAAARDHDAVTTATLVVILELAALSLLVLVQVVGGAVDARGNEIALAKLRGLPARKTVIFALGEPISLLLIAAPIGLALGYGVTVVLTHAALVPGTPVTFTTATGWAVGAAFAGSAAAAVLAGIRTMTRPVLEQWRNTSLRRHATRSGLTISVALALAAGAVSTALRIGSSSRPRPILLLAPGLIVFAIALLGVQVLPRLGRLGLEPTRSSHKIATFLALRQTVRRPSGLRVAALLAVAAGLATFAICGEAVAAGNRSARAETELGATRQVSVEYEAGHDPESIVDAVDPNGRWAMATAAWVPDGGGIGQPTVTGTLLGVQAARVANTVYPVRGQLSPSALTTGITAKIGQVATFTGSAVRVTIDLTALAGNTASVDIDVRRGYDLPMTLPAGQLHFGTHTYTASVDCRAGCTFTGVTFARPITAPITQLITGTATLTSVETATGTTFSPLPVEVNKLAAWRGGQDGIGATSSVALTSQGISISFRSDVGSSAILVHADYASNVPMVAAPKSLSTVAPHGSVADFTGTVTPYHVTKLAKPLPDVLDAGAIADLSYLRLNLPNFATESVWTVWLGPHAPADAMARLQRAGLLVEHTSTEATRLAELGRQGPALGLLLLLVCAIAAALLATGGCAVSIMADARRRSFELAALRVVGVGQKALRRSAITEQALLLGAAVLLGLPSGYLAAYLVLPVIPEFSDTTPVAMRFGPSIELALICMAVFAVLLALTANVAGRMLVRAAVPVRLREAG